MKQTYLLLLLLLLLLFISTFLYIIIIVDYIRVANKKPSQNNPFLEIKLGIKKSVFFFIHCKWISSAIERSKTKIIARKKTNSHFTYSNDWDSVMLCVALRFLSVHIFINILLKHVFRRYRHVLACLLLQSVSLSLCLSLSISSSPSSLSFYLRLYLSQFAQRFLFLQLFTHFGFISFFFSSSVISSAKRLNSILYYYCLYYI